MTVKKSRRIRFGRFDRLVRCAAGHVFVTTWVPLIPFKGVRIGEQRFQYCPVGRHWRMVEPVGERPLTEAELAGTNTDRGASLPYV